MFTLLLLQLLCIEYGDYFDCFFHFCYFVYPFQQFYLRAKQIARTILFYLAAAKNQLADYSYNWQEILFMLRVSVFLIYFFKQILW